jgi:hypothetical protein
MSDQETPQTPPPDPGAKEQWKEVGGQFKTLGETLAAAFKATWENPQVRDQAKDVKDGLESMVNQVGAAIKEAVASPEAQKIKGEASKAAVQVRDAGEQAVQSARPHMISALKRVSQELGKLVESLEKAPPPPPPPSEPPAG